MRRLTHGLLWLLLLGLASSCTTYLEQPTPPGSVPPPGPIEMNEEDDDEEESSSDLAHPASVESRSPSRPLKGGLS